MCLCLSRASLATAKDGGEETVHAPDGGQRGERRALHLQAMRRGEVRHLRLVLLAQHRARGVHNAPVPLQEGQRRLEDGALLLDQLLQKLRLCKSLCAMRMNKSV